MLTSDFYFMYKCIFVFETTDFQWNCCWRNKQYQYP